MIHELVLREVTNMIMLMRLDFLILYTRDIIYHGYCISCINVLVSCLDCLFDLAISMYIAIPLHPKINFRIKTK